MDILIFELLVIVSLLRYLKVIDRQSVFIYLIGSLFIRYWFSFENAHFLILLFFGISYIFYVLGVSIKENLHKLSNISFNIVIFYSNIFFSGFVFSFIFMPLSFISRNFFVMFFMIFVVHLFVEWLNEKEIFKRKPYKYLNYRFFFIILFSQLVLFEQITLILNYLYIGGLYVLIYIVYSFVFYGFTKEIKISQIKPGMISAEQIIKSGKIYKKNKLFYLSPQFYFRSKLMQFIKKYDVVINTTKPLSLGDISMIKNISKAYKFDTFKIQRSIDMRPFVFIGMLEVIVYLI